MAFEYDIRKTQADLVSTRSLFWCQILHKIIIIFTNTFLSAYLYKLSTDMFDYITNVGIYNIAIYVSYFLSYGLFAFLVDNTNRVWVYRISFFMKIVMLIALIIMGESMSHYLILCGMLYGISEACYYSSYNVLKQEMVSRKLYKQYSVVMSVLSKVVSIIIPIVFGALLSITTYAHISIYVAIVAVCAQLLSFWIHAQKPATSRYDLKGYLKLFKEYNQTSKKLNFIYIMFLIYGFFSATEVVVNICVMLKFGSTLHLGNIASIIAIVSICSLLAIWRFTKTGRRKTIFGIFSILPLITSLALAFSTAPSAVIVYNITMGILMFILASFTDVYRNSFLKENGLYDYIGEHQSIIEFALSFTQALAFAIIILIANLHSELAFNICVIFFSLSHSILFILLIIFEKKYFTENSEKNSMKIIRKCLKDL